MRPRPRAVENNLPQYQVNPFVGASMRPRPVSWRTSLNVSGEATDTTLQCGHGLVPWRTTGQICRMPLDCLASMRPRPRAVENVPAAFASGRPSNSFNAATASCRGELLIPWRSLNKLPLLQCGHGLGPWRTKTPMPSRVASSALQCGHGPCRGEPWIAGCKLFVGNRFNAATASCRGELLLRLPEDLYEGMLQCGHGPCRGEHRRGRHGALRLDASMRPRPRAVENLQSPCHIIATMRSLQCGHDPCRGERSRRRRFRKPGFTLQCGHGLVPWRTKRILRPFRLGYALQCGHGLGPWRTAGSSCVTVRC